MTILTKILAQKAVEIEQLKQQAPTYVADAKQRPSLFETLNTTNRLHVIAEMKRASPSKGLIAEGANPVAQGMAYEQAGAACISVLTDECFFKGSFEDLQNVANAVSIPLLCKDFVIDEVQIDYAKAAGASVVLLIVAALDDMTLQRLHDYATSLDLDILVETHNVDELHRALRIGAKIIGVNNRNLHDFSIDLAHTEDIAAHFPFNEERIFISESGIWTSEDAARVAKAGAKAVLVGESLMRSDSVQSALQSLQVPLLAVKR
ncbi:indole-3-glycerol phosphate synthase TrpC [Caryophanon tenue]|uniref:Indole-3-glycerol phosphate synthase n=1 Tax=Caryophanon tenue TaxID=33978 RepID=A0A1C0Y8B0_9BACL|nr:indole-3-glycerol phosphate synthase TrpC [Caryophanon tenue]OCS83391.1 indole-3-glycerol phosphate synthase [Caryophanon tenue]